MKKFNIATIVSVLWVMPLYSFAAGDPAVNLLLNQKCQDKISKAATAEYCAVLVTNDAKTQLVTYLSGSVRAGSGSLDELISDRGDCLEQVPPSQGGFGGCALMQPFSIRQKENALINISRDGKVAITWPGGGVTTNKPSCSANGAFVFEQSSYTAVLTLKPCPGPR